MKIIHIHKDHDKVFLEGFIFFSERIRELLAHSTIDSFKASALNTKTRARELERLFRHAYDTTQRAHSLSPLLEEFTESLKNDPVIGRLGTKNSFDRMLNDIEAGLNDEKPRLVSEAIDALNAINILLINYYSSAKNLLCSLISEGKKKKLISILAEILVIEIQFRGYSREHIRHISKTKLAGKLLEPKKFEIDSALNEFFSFFEGDGREYSCVVRCKGEIDDVTASALKWQVVEKIENFKQIELLNISDKANAEKTEMPLDKYLLASTVRGRDPFSARTALYSQLYTQNAINLFFQHKSPFEFASNCLVQDNETKHEIRIGEPINVMLIGQTSKTLTLGFAEKQIEFLTAFDRFDEKSRKAIISVIRYHKDAMDSFSVENKLVDLWAALEGFVPQPIDQSPRVSSVIDHILPAQTLIYAEKKFLYVTAGIEKIGKSALDILDSSGVEGKLVRKVAAIILCPEFEEQVNQITALMEHSPLLRFRMFLLKDTFSTPQKACDEFIRHRRRIEHQLKRIYISRNTVMHSATVHSDLDLLVENLHSYLDLMVNATLTVGANSPRRTNINAVLKLLCAHEKSYLNSLSKTKESDNSVTRENFDQIFGVGINPLLKFIN